jgi:predicted enzyme related to lactoylglutathione lyase
MTTTIIFPVKDLGAAKAVFQALLGEPVMDQPYYVQFAPGDQEVGLDPHGFDKGMTGPVTYWHVEDIRSVVAELVAAGAEEVQAVSDVGGGRLIATVRTGDAVVGVLQP